MKIILSMLLICFCSMVTAQHTSIIKNVSDNGKIFSIKVNGIIDGKRVDYANTFSSIHLSKNERETFIKHIYDSLGVGDTITLLEVLKNIESSVVVESKNGISQIIPKSDSPRLYAASDQHPYSKEIKYNPKSGTLYMQYSFTKNGEESVYEKTIDTNAASEEQPNSIIRKYEKEIGLPVTEK